MLQSQAVSEYLLSYRTLGNPVKRGVPRNAGGGSRNEGGGGLELKPRRSSKMNLRGIQKWSRMFR